MTDGQVFRPEQGKRMALPVPGYTVIFKAWGEREPGNHDIAEFVLEPGFPGPQPHVHQRHEELFYVLEGDLEFLVGEQAVLLGPGSFIHVPPGVVHDFRNRGSVRARCLLVACPSGLDRYFEEMAALGSEGRFSASALEELRKRYDTDGVDVSWST